MKKEIEKTTKENKELKEQLHFLMKKVDDLTSKAPILAKPFTQEATHIEILCYLPSTLTPPPPSHIPFSISPLILIVSLPQSELAQPTLSYML